MAQGLGSRALGFATYWSRREASLLSGIFSPQTAFIIDNLHHKGQQAGKVLRQPIHGLDKAIAMQKLCKATLVDDGFWHAKPQAPEP